MPGTKLQTRKKAYLQEIRQGIKQIKSFQQLDKDSAYYGSFFYAGHKKRLHYSNARWQEAVLSLAYDYKYRISKLDIKDNPQRIIAGIDYWCKIQHKDGSFEEYGKDERSFAATAFSLYAVAESASIIGKNKRWKPNILRAADWLSKNDEIILTNQESAAALALLAVYKLFKIKKYFLEANKKINIVLNNQMPNGHYSEKKEVDRGYSSLTVEILSRYYSLIPTKAVLNSVKKYFNNLGPADGPNIRNTNWCLIAGFEFFSHYCTEAEKALALFLQHENIIHLPDDRHVCTDLYRLYWAFMNINEAITSRKIIAYRHKSTQTGTPKMIFLRRIGMHKIRKWRYIFR